MVGHISKGTTAALLLLACGCQRPAVIPAEDVPPKRVVVVAKTPKGRTPSEGQTKVLGNGWYANVEVDSRDRIHVAYTDADLGDVLYAVSLPGQTALGPPEPVEVEGAVGSYLNLAIAPGDAPVLSYYHQGRRQLRLAYRPNDIPAMRAAGVSFGDPLRPLKSMPLVPGERPPPAPGSGMGPGWNGEDVAFGDNVGMASSLLVDGSGRPHLFYYAKGERARYAARPKGLPAFGPSVAGRWEKIDVDTKAGGSYTMGTDLIALSDGTVLASYCNWNFVDAQLKIAMRRPGQRHFTVIEAENFQRRVDGWHSALLPRSDGLIDVYSVATGDQRLLRGVFNPKAPGPLTDRQEIMGRPGATAIVRSKDGTLWIATRGQGFESLGESPGVWLVEIPAGDVSRPKKYVLEKGLGANPWIDIALRKNGRPVVVWTSQRDQVMRMYVH